MILRARGRLHGNQPTQGLVDELRLMIFPVILGSGKRVFPDTPDKITLEPADTRTYGEVVVHT
jgi:dihydrofolate reductase